MKTPKGLLFSRFFLGLMLHGMSLAFCVESHASARAGEGSFSDSRDHCQLFLLYQPAQVLLSDHESARRSCAMLLAETVAIDKLAQSLEGKLSHYLVYSEGKVLLPSSITVQVSLPVDQEERVTALIKEAADHIVAEGINHDELNLYRHKILYQFDCLLQNTGSEEQKYIYDLMEKEYLALHPTLPFAEFLYLSQEYLSSASVDELFCALYLYLHPSNRILESLSEKDLEDEVRIEGAADLWNEDLQPASGLLPTDPLEHSGGFAAMKRGLSAGGSSDWGSTDLYYQLTLSDLDKKIIKKIITNMGEKNVFQLLLDKRDMEKMGRQIRHVHPMRFIGYILSESPLRRHLSSISHNHFKWAGFLDGFKDRMKEEAKKGQLTPYISGLAELLSVDPSSIAGYIHRGDYEGLVRHFI